LLTESGGKLLLDAPAAAPAGALMTEAGGALRTESGGRILI
jgi:hypothetical protein